MPSLPRILAIFSMIACAQASVVITPAGVGTATGLNPGPADFAGMFDSQPSNIPTLGATSDPMGAGYGFYNSLGRIGYIDFGTGYDHITLEAVYVGLKMWGGASTAVVTYWWSSSNDSSFDPDDGDLAQTDLGIFTSAGSGGSQLWTQTWTGSLEIPRQYLLLRFDSGDTGNSLNELVFAGTIPEPTSLGLMLFGAGLVSLRRRRP